jgi:hypothetical protein
MWKERKDVLARVWISYLQVQTSPLYYHHSSPPPYPCVKDYLVAEEEMMEEMNFCTLEQWFVEGEYVMRPPLHPWERRKSWKHPAKKRIQEYLRGEWNVFVEEWSSEYINKMA